MARVIENPDGIYPTLTVPLGEMTEAEQQSIAKNCNYFLSIGQILDRYERALEPFKTDPEIIRKAFEPMSLPADIGFLVFAAVPDDPPDVRNRKKTAWHLALAIRGLRLHLASGDVEKAACLGIEIGGLAERLHAMQFEHYVVQVRGTTRKLRAGAAAQAHSPEDISRAIQLYQKRLKTHPKKTAAQRWVREQTGIPESVLRYHLAKRKGTAK